MVRRRCSLNTKEGSPVQAANSYSRELYEYNSACTVKSLTKTAVRLTSSIHSLFEFSSFGQPFFIFGPNEREAGGENRCYHLVRARWGEYHGKTGFELSGLRVRRSRFVAAYVAMISIASFYQAFFLSMTKVTRVSVRERTF